MGSVTDFTILQPVFDWLRTYLRMRHDMHFTKVVHRSPLWYLYDDDGEFVAKAEETLIDRLYFALHANHFTMGEPELISQVALTEYWNEIDRNWADDEDDASEWDS